MSTFSASKSTNRWTIPLTGPKSTEFETVMQKSVDGHPHINYGDDSSLSLNWLRRHLGTKSPYPHEDRPIGPLNDTPEGYELTQLHLICRHGTRYPSSSNAISFQKMTERLRLLDVPGFEWLRNWPSETLYPVAKGNLLSPKGDSDLYRIGRRFAVRYKEFLDRYPYDAKTFQFQSSAKSRCSQSAYAFSVGLLEGRLVNDPGVEDYPPTQPIDMFTTPIGLDRELAVKYACPRWLKSVRYGPSVLREVQTFQAKFLPKLAEQMSTLLTSRNGSKQSNVTTKDVMTIYDMCAFEVASYNNDQTWCQLLRKAVNVESSASKAYGPKLSFLNMEIVKDLEDYYTFGPGIPFNRHLGCILGTTLFNSIEAALGQEAGHPYSGKQGGDNDDERLGLFRGVFKFGHSETIFFFSSFLGLYDQKKIPLRGDMTPEEYAKREFRSSKLSQFASNMAFEVFRPNDGEVRRKRRLVYDKDSVQAHFMTEAETPRGLIRLLVNEEPMIIPGCGSGYFCEWSTFKKILQQAGSGCDFEGCCTSLNSSDILSKDTLDVPFCPSVEPVTE
ncbi:PHOsphatase [Lobosporangium transversale]|nr:PHOsphatase [Lobosporangium transversale]